MFGITVEHGYIEHGYIELLSISNSANIPLKIPCKSIGLLCACIELLITGKFDISNSAPKVPLKVCFL